MNQRAFMHTRYGRKRASCDTGKTAINNLNDSYNPQRVTFKEPKNKSSSRKEQKFQFTLKPDLLNQIPSKKNNNLSLHSTSRYNTHRAHISNSNNTKGETVLELLKQPQNLSDLREQVQQLRMENQNLREENQNLREELKGSQVSETEMKYQVMKLKQMRESERSEYESQISALSEKIEQYGLKIKQLYEELIKEKKKHIGRHGDHATIHEQKKDQHSRSILSPTLSSVTNINYFRNFQQKGEKEFYTRKKYENIGNYRADNWSVEHSYMSGQVSNKAVY